VKRIREKRKATLAEKAYEIIKRGIVRGDIEEGTFLSEAEFMRRHDIGRTPFREACNRLHHEQLLEVVPRRGYLVSEISLRSVRELLEVRSILEAVCAELAASRHMAAEAEELREAAERSWSGNGSGEFESVVRTNTDFHLCIARMTHNRELVRLMQSVLDRSERLSYIEVRVSKVPQGDVESLHRPIVNAICDRNPAAARDAILHDIARGELDILGSEQRTDRRPSAAPLTIARHS
jgi:DNA-binding GntR family transcriptional regulator